MVTIKFENIPTNLQELPHWALYTEKKAPIKLSAVARGWPADGWNDGLTGEAAIAGAKSNDPSTWGTFEDCQRLWQRKTPLIVGPAFALTEDIGITVIDLDDPETKLKNMDVKAPVKAMMLEAAQKSQGIALSMFAGHYIERSVSGKGAHIFVLGRLPAMKYKFAFHGEVFGCCQFINMTGDVL
jgi:primase-polymerase (primpol)-like protein